MKITPHKSYTKNAPLWERCRTTVEGDRALKESSFIQQVVPPLSKEHPNEYAERVNRPTLFNASARTLEGLVGMVMRKPVVITGTAKDRLQYILDDVTLALGDKCDINDFCSDMLEEKLEVSGGGYLVERPSVNTEGMTVAEVSALNLRCYVAEYDIESIVDWRYARVNNATQLVMVRLVETIENWTSEIERESIEQERRLLLVEVVDPKTKVSSYEYHQQIWREDDKGNLIQIGSDIVPMMNGRPLHYIPFVADLDDDKPPLLDLVEVNLSHFATDVDYHHGAHYTGIPTPMMAGFQLKEDEVFCLGAKGGYASPEPSAKWGYLEFTGQGLQTLQNLKDEKVHYMSVLGARFLEQDKMAAEATQTIKIRKSGETSVLAATAKEVSREVTRLFEIIAEWEGIDGDIKIELNTDYSEAGATPQDIQAWMAATQGSLMSHQTFFYNMQAAEMYEDGLTFEEEQARIDSQNIGGGLLAP